MRSMRQPFEIMRIPLASASTQNLATSRCFLSMAASGIGSSCPGPDMPLTVGFDGGYIHSCVPRSRKHGCFEVIAGKSVTDDGASKGFAFGNNHDEKPRRRVFEVLKSQGIQSNQQVRFLSDVQLNLQRVRVKTARVDRMNSNHFLAISDSDHFALKKRSCFSVADESKTKHWVSASALAQHLEAAIKGNQYPS